ncbi:MAG TPA: hypothetical protein VE269_01240 [Gaiellaceae bacterium]|nr:hypothetical protein [Gaiellaceae bacterium]
MATETAHDRTHSTPTLIVGRQLFGNESAFTLPVVREPVPERALRQARRLRPDLVVIDAEAAPDVATLVARMRRAAPQSAVVIVGDAPTRPDVARALRAGAAGYIGSNQPKLPLFASLIGAPAPLQVSA